MRKIIILLTALLLAGAANTPARDSGPWRYNCINAENTGWRMCGVSYDAIVPRMQSETLVILSIAAQRGDEPTLFIIAREPGVAEPKIVLCMYREALIRVDGARVATLEKEYSFIFSHKLGSAGTRLAIDRFLKGSSAVLTLHFLPGCAPRDLPISLEGFPAVWREFQERQR